MDPIQTLLASKSGRDVVRRLGLSAPPVLRRFEPGQPLLVGPALVGGTGSGVLAKAAVSALEDAGARVTTSGTDGPRDGERLGALVFDASGIETAEDLVLLRDFFSAPLRRLSGNGRVVVLGTEPAAAPSASARIAQRALEGFTRSLGKELRGGSTANLVLVSPGAEDRLESTLLFLASSRSAFVDGQVVRVGVAAASSPGDVPEDGLRPLAGRGVVVTGASRGIGAAMVSVFARCGATVIGVDVPALASDLKAVTSAVGGGSVVADITTPDVAARIVAEVARHDVPLHGLVHNAGITRDRKLVNIDRATWQQVLGVNLVAVQRVTEELVDEGALGPGSRVVGISSIAGIAGNVGQTNYAASKAGVIGLVDALAPMLAARGITLNAIAPGFIETQMTQRVPLVTREGGRRLSSLGQGGLPVDVAETAAWFCDPRSVGLSGNVVRVCGQGLIGA